METQEEIKFYASENKKDQGGRRKSCLHKAPKKKKQPHNVIVAMKIVFLVIK